MLREINIGDLRSASQNPMHKLRLVEEWDRSPLKEEERIWLVNHYLPPLRSGEHVDHMALDQIVGSEFGGLDEPYEPIDMYFGCAYWGASLFLSILKGPIDLELPTVKPYLRYFDQTIKGKGVHFGVQHAGTFLSKLVSSGKRGCGDELARLVTPGLRSLTSRLRVSESNDLEGRAIYWPGLVPIYTIQEVVR